MEKKAIEEEILGKVDDEHIVARKQELEEMMKQYKVGSLERMAVEEEIEKKKKEFMKKDPKIFLEHILESIEEIESKEMPKLQDQVLEILESL